MHSHLFSPLIVPHVLPLFRPPSYPRILPHTKAHTPMISLLSPSATPLFYTPNIFFPPYFALCVQAYKKEQPPFSLPTRQNSYKVLQSLYFPAVPTQLSSEVSSPPSLPIFPVFHSVPRLTNGLPTSVFPVDPLKFLSALPPFPLRLSPCLLSGSLSHPITPLDGSPLISAGLCHPRPL